MDILTVIVVLVVIFLIMSFSGGFSAMGLDFLSPSGIMSGIGSGVSGIGSGVSGIGKGVGSVF